MERMLHWESGNLEHRPGSAPDLHVTLDESFLSGLGAENTFTTIQIFQGTALRNGSGLNSGLHTRSLVYVSKPFRGTTNVPSVESAGPGSCAGFATLERCITGHAN